MSKTRLGVVMLPSAYIFTLLSIIFRAASGALVACDELQARFSEESSGVEIPKYIAPNSSTYLNRTIVSWSSNCWQNASCIVSPASPKDVAEVLSIVTSTGASFSIRSGGHDFNKNHSSVEGGVIIDLVNLNGISLSADGTNVTIGVGRRWGEVYKALNGTGVSVNGARDSSPGVGGQTLAGGQGWFSSIAGVTAASVIAAEVVLANSSIIHATEEYAADLLWALKGGGPNYGIVTSFTFKTLPVKKVWSLYRSFSSDKNQKLLDALIEYGHLASHDNKASLAFGLSQDTSSPRSFVWLFYADTTEFPDVFRPFYDIEPATEGISSTVGTQADFALPSPQFPDPGTVPLRHYVVTLPHKRDNATYRDGYAAYTSFAEQAIASGWTMSYGSQLFSVSAVKASSKTPLGLEVVDQDWIHCTLQWENPEDDTVAMQLIVNLGQRLAEVSAVHNSQLDYRFMNDAYDGQNALSSYGAENFKKLLDISKIYDPTRVFQRLQHGGWLLSKEI
ncbi:FAD-binding domain-containing protein [Daldinia vernicosa]|uniref:FAD-binding domain-containing protein n=1 Tax=Daldinia vernicosa TaxID=114800 RepID=UPI002007AE9F|nr:FAD-binding domain-containing protein [Daldinia vernicosa]KAI0850467.1 FAD-binding domain-containing protein [Daldinia vernicosa]